MIVVLLLIIIAILLFGSSAVIGAVGTIAGFIALIAALVLGVGIIAEFVDVTPDTVVLSIAGLASFLAGASILRRLFRPEKSDKVSDALSRRNHKK